MDRVISTCSIHRDEAPVNPVAVLNPWLFDAYASGIHAVQTFATSSQRDEAVIKAVLTLYWSNEQAEG